MAFELRKRLARARGRRDRGSRSADRRSAPPPLRRVSGVPALHARRPLGGHLGPPGREDRLCAVRGSATGRRARRAASGRGDGVGRTRREAERAADPGFRDDHRRDLRQRPTCGWERPSAIGARGARRPASPRFVGIRDIAAWDASDELHSGAKASRRVPTSTRMPSFRAGFRVLGEMGSPSTPTTTTRRLPVAHQIWRARSRA